MTGLSAFSEESQDFHPDFVHWSGIKISLPPPGVLEVTSWSPCSAYRPNLAPVRAFDGDAPFLQILGIVGMYNSYEEALKYTAPVMKEGESEIYLFFNVQNKSLL